MTSHADRDEALALDAADELAEFRRRFFLPPARHGDPAIYFAGHSLGLQPFAARRAMERALDDWAELGVGGWSDPRTAWTRADEDPAARTARLVGAEPDEVCVSGTLTTNLHALLTTFCRPSAERPLVLMEANPFPSDRYAVASHLARHGFDPERSIVESPSAPEPGGTSQDRILDAISEYADRLALVLVGGVNYLSGEAFEPGPLVAAAHTHGIPIGLDLAHAVGNVPFALHDSGVDFAVWCGYKYLNGGPGAPGGLFVHRRHHERTDLHRLAGWWGHRLDDRFRMPSTFDPARGAAGWQISTPSILALAPLAASLELFEEAGAEALRRKSLALTSYLERLIRDRLADRVIIVTPGDPARRGAQLSMRLSADVRSVHERLTAVDVVCDRREPDVIRVAPTPFYNTFDEARRFVDLLATAIGE